MPNKYKEVSKRKRYLTHPSTECWLPVLRSFCLTGHLVVGIVGQFFDISCCCGTRELFADSFFFFYLKSSSRPTLDIFKVIFQIKALYTMCLKRTSSFWCIGPLSRNFKSLYLLPYTQDDYFQYDFSVFFFF